MTRKKKPSGRKLPDKGRRVKKRTVRTRPLRQRFLVVCEGEKTEPNYFREFRVWVEVKIVGTGKDTMDVVKHAERLRDEAQRQGREYDQCWAVFDLDEFPSSKFNDAIRRAQNKGIQPAYSNPAFELWFLLHFEDRQTPITRQECQRRLKRHLGGYTKTKTGMRSLLEEQENTAINRADRLCRSYQPHNPAHDNPCTTVYRLVKELKKQSA